MTINDERINEQQAPYPDPLQQIVDGLQTRPGWRFYLADKIRDEDSRGVSKGLTFVVITQGYDSYHQDRGQQYCVYHYFPVPPATYDHRSWRRWVFDCLLKVETHELCEFFAIDGERPYAPSHGPGNDPYMVREVGTELDRRTRFTGEVVAA